MESVVVIPNATNFCYDASNIFFKDRVYRRKEQSNQREKDRDKERPKDRENESHAEYTSTQVTYINNATVMTGLTFFINIENPHDVLNAYAVDVEELILRLYINTYALGGCNKRVCNMVRDDLSEMTYASNKNIALHITGVWENTKEIGLEYKWLHY